MPHYDLVIVGTGSGNSIPGPEFSHWRIAIVEAGTFGGTCLNVGCIPSKMFEYPAEVAGALTGADTLGIHGEITRVDWPAIRDRIFGRIDPIAASGRAYRQGPECPNIEVYSGTGRFVGDKRMHVTLHSGGSAELTADRFVLAAGSRAVVPPIPGLDQASWHTSDTVMRIDTLPQRVMILGGGFIAAEFGHIFASLGAQVTQVARSDRLLTGHDRAISARYTDVVAHRYDLRLRSTIAAIDPAPAGSSAFVAHLAGPQGDSTVEADLLLIAVGRRPNGDELAVTATGVALSDDGYVVVDDHQQTGVPGVWALGDLSSPYQLKHVANHEARVVAHNLAHPDDLIAADHRFVPSAVFTFPQIASAGLTEEAAADAGLDVVTAQREYGGVAAGWAREDTTGFCKVIAERSTGRLVGVHLIGPEAATVIQPALTAMQFGIPAHDLARGQYWIHPALPEVLENALLELPEPEPGPAADGALGRPARAAATGW